MNYLVRIFSFLLIVLSFFLLSSSSAYAYNYPNYYNIVNSNSVVYQIAPGGDYVGYAYDSNDNPYGPIETICLYLKWVSGEHYYSGGIIESIEDFKNSSAQVNAYFTENPQDLGYGWKVDTSCINLRARRALRDSEPPNFCSLAEKTSPESPSQMDKFISIFPSSPENMRLPTILSNLGGQGSLAGNLALELYSAVWQYLAIIVFVKFYKLLPGKMT